MPGVFVCLFMMQLCYRTYVGDDRLRFSAGFKVLALFNKSVRKLCSFLTQVAEKAAGEEMESKQSKQKRLDTMR